MPRTFKLWPFKSGRQRQLDRMECLLDTLVEQGTIIMATSAETLQAVRDAHTVGDSLVALTTEIKRRLDEALADESVPAAVQADIDAVFSEVTAQKDKYEAAILANTPSEPTP